MWNKKEEKKNRTETVGNKNDSDDSRKIKLFLHFR